MIGKIRERIVSRFGPTAVHAAEDGATVAATLALAATYPPAAAAVLLAVGVDSLKPRKALKALDRVVREEDVAKQPAYFLAGMVGGGAVGYGVGTVAARLLPRMSWSEVVRYAGLL